MFNDDVLLWLARIIGILGLSLLVLSSVGGVMLRSERRVFDALQSLCLQLFQDRFRRAPVIVFAILSR